MRPLIIVVVALALLVGCSTLSSDPETTDSAEHAAPTTPPAGAGPERSGPETLQVETAQGENGAARPWWNGSRLQAEIPREVPPSDKYRSEVFWAHPSGTRVRLEEGDRFSCRIDVTPHLGPAAADRDHWQVLWQLHGPDRAGTWHPPPLNLHVRGETWRIGGGAGRRQGGREAYAQPFPEFVDGREARWRIDVVVSQDPDTARVDAWLDDRPVVTNWHPPSGTRYPDHDYLTMKSGLYVGSADGADVPKARRWTTQTPPRCTFMSEAGAATSP